MTVVREIWYRADGLELRGTLAVPDGPGPFPAVLIGHEGPGLDHIQRHRASDVAALGYVGFALDYHGSLSPFADRDAMMDRLGELFANPERNRALGVVALAVVRREPSVDSTRIAAIGYRFGPWLRSNLPAPAPTSGRSSGSTPGLTNIRPDDSRNIEGRVLLCIGTDGPMVPLEHRATRYRLRRTSRQAIMECDARALCRGVLTHPLGT